MKLIKWSIMVFFLFVANCFFAYSSEISFEPSSIELYYSQYDSQDGFNIEFKNNMDSDINYSILLSDELKNIVQFVPDQDVIEPLASKEVIMFLNGSRLVNNNFINATINVTINGIDDIFGLHLIIFFDLEEDGQDTNKITGYVVLINELINKNNKGVFIILFISLLIVAVISYCYGINKFGSA